MLEPVVGRTQLSVRGRNIQEALESAFIASPVLRHHLALADGKLRPHILCILNGLNIPRNELRSTRLSNGDELLIHQAISGG